MAERAINSCVKSLDDIIFSIFKYADDQYLY